MTEADKFWSKVDKSGECWIWKGAISRGYGAFTVRRDRPMVLRAHRWAYEFSRSPIPDGLQIDHLCRNKACVNPDHLEVVTSKENTRRGLNVNGLKLVCPRNHPYSVANTALTIDKKGYVNRRCRECERLRSIRRKAAARRDFGLEGDKP